MSRHLIHPLPDDHTRSQGDIIWREDTPWKILEIREDNCAVIVKVNSDDLHAPQSRGIPTVSHTTYIVCAKCGGETALSNSAKEDATTLRLHTGGRLYFHCPSCGNIYPLPYMTD